MKLRIILVLLVSSIIINVYFSVKIWWSSQYDAESFNCKDMSYALASVFHRFGFAADVVYGRNAHSAHCWVSLYGVYFDATTLWFNSEEGYSVDFVDRYPYGYWDELGVNGS